MTERGMLCKEINRDYNPSGKGNQERMRIKTSFKQEKLGSIKKVLKSINIPLFTAILISTVAAFPTSTELLKLLLSLLSL